MNDKTKKVDALCPMCEGTPEGTIVGMNFVQGYCKTCDGTGRVVADPGET